MEDIQQVVVKEVPRVGLTDYNPIQLKVLLVPAARITVAPTRGSSPPITLLSVSDLRNFGLQDGTSSHYLLDQRQLDLVSFLLV
jgi:hypothetical protein